MTRWAPVKTDHSAAWHHERFLEFVRAKQLVGEPSPHMTLAGWISKNQSWEERVWRAGVYAAPYSVLTSVAIWNHWPYDKAKDDPAGLALWISQNWAGFHIRTERRMVRTPSSFSLCLLSYLSWMNGGAPQALMNLQELATDQEAYDLWYKSVGTTMYFGRYITIRVVEFLRRYAGAKAELYDIRSVGGESPVRCLSLLYPEYETDLLVLKDSKTAEVLGEELLARVQAELPHVGHYVLAAMLCEYREAYEDHHQYPGRTIDQELDYMLGPKGQYWGDEVLLPLMAARADTLPVEALGEFNGWSGVRHDLSKVLRDKGLVWSDITYMYPSREQRHG